MFLKIFIKIFATTIFLYVNKIRVVTATLHLYERKTFFTPTDFFGSS